MTFISLELQGTQFWSTYF